jgi:hypothetical protein
MACAAVYGRAGRLRARAHDRIALELDSRTWGREGTPSDVRPARATVVRRAGDRGGSRARGGASVCARVAGVAGLVALLAACAAGPAAPPDSLALPAPEDLRAVAEVLLRDKFTPCGDSYYSSVRAPDASGLRLVTEYKGLTIDATPAPLTPVERERGIEAMAFVEVKATERRSMVAEAHRRGAWDRWEATGHIAGAAMFKRDGRWDFEGGEAGDDLRALEPVRCDDVPDGAGDRSPADDVPPRGPARGRRT